MLETLVLIVHTSTLTENTYTINLNDSAASVKFLYNKRTQSHLLLHRVNQLHYSKGTREHSVRVCVSASYRPSECGQFF